MIWLITLFLLAVAAWFLINGINEKQWVDAHLHDDDVAGDEGLFKTFTRLTEGDNGDDKVSNVVSNVKKRTSEVSGQFGERITEARQSNTADKIREKTSGITDRIKEEASNEDGLFNKIRSKVASGVEKAGQKVDEKIVNKR